MGWWGGTLIDSVQQSDKATFVSGYTRSRSEQDQEIARKHNLTLPASYEAMLADPAVQGVVLATPPPGHCDQMLAAIAAGKHIFCEKPFTMTRAEAVKVVEAARAKGVTLAVGYSRRFHPSWLDLKRRIAEGELGTILHVECTMSGPNGLIPNPQAWRGDSKSAPCGGLFPMGVHAVDGMIDLLGDIDSVFCQSFRRATPNPNDDTTSVLFRMKGGMSGYLGTMMATAGSFRFQVYGSKAMALLGGTVHVAGQSSEHRRTTLFGSYVIQPVKGDAIAIEVPSFDVVRAALESFAVAAQGGAPYPIPPEQIISGVSVTDAIIASSKSSKLEQVA